MKITHKNARVGMQVQLNRHPYKPFQIVSVTKAGVRLHPLSPKGDTYTYGRTFSPAEFDECEYYNFDSLTEDHTLDQPLRDDKQDG